VVDEEPPADGGPGVDLDPRQEAGQLGDQPRRETQGGFLPQPVGQAVEPDRMQAGVGKEVLKGTSSRRVV
jgi:hypothetical protein